MNLKETKKFSLNIKPGDIRVIELAQHLIEYLTKQSKEILLPPGMDFDLPQEKISIVDLEDLFQQCDILIALGGDGTLLNAARSIANKDIPLIGINLGHLGFLVEITPQKMEYHLDNILNNRYRLEERIMFSAQYFHKGELYAEHVACNDVVVKQYASGRMVNLATSINDAPVSIMYADGLIVSTPTGSTAYALSSGGPLIEPTLEATLLVPICPHTLSHRPLIIDAHKSVTIEHTPQNEENALSSIDGQIDIIMQPGDCVVIKTLPTKLKLIQPEQHDYFETLRNKLHWSETL